MAVGPRCAVVIPTFNGAHLLSTCLEALFANPPERCEWRVIIVDDASSDRTVERFSSFDGRVTMIAREQNGGFAESCNDGARAAGDADYIVFLNNDTVPIAGWLDELVDEATSHPEAGAVGAKLLYPDGTIQHAGVMISHDRWPRHIYVGFPGNHPAVNRSKQVVAATAACLLVRRPVFEELGGFDAAFHNGFEDVDLCLRLGELGHQVRYCPRSALYHLESVTRWADDATGHIIRNNQLYAERWQDRVSPDDLDNYFRDGLISIDYGATYPVKMKVSPHLAIVERQTGEDDQIEKLLEVRTEQVLDLRIRSTRAALEQQRQGRAPSRSPERRRSGGTARVVNRGEFHRIGYGEPGHRVSVLMPLMDAGDALRSTLPMLFEQEIGAELEIVAVDSASTDDTIDVLEEFGATVLSIDPAEFDHGLTRNLLAKHAQGDVLVFLNGSSRPCDRGWLAPLLADLDAEPHIAGVCSRVLPHPGADPLTQRDGGLDPSGSAKRSIKHITDWDAYRGMPVEQRRLLLNFHTVSTAIRPEVLRRIPFQSVRTLGEDLLWAREVLESGLALVHEPDSRVYHSHDYNLRDWFMRNVDDGVANRDIVERSLSSEEVDGLVRAMVASDWAHLRDELGLEGEELEHWQIQAALRRAAQGAGQWLGVNHAALPADAVSSFSLIANTRRGDR